MQCAAREVYSTVLEGEEVLQIAWKEEECVCDWNSACTCHPKGPCPHIAHTLAPMYLYRDYFRAKVYTI